MHLQSGTHSKRDAEKNKNKNSAGSSPKEHIWKSTLTKVFCVRVCVAPLTGSNRKERERKEEREKRKPVKFETDFMEIDFDESFLCACVCCSSHRFLKDPK